MESDYSFKICLFGDGGVGKTTLTNRYMTGNFNPDISMTLGANILVKKLYLDGKKISLQIWDFGGEDMYKFLLPSYSVGSSGGIFMFDVTRIASLMNAEDWIKTFKSNLEQKDLPMLLVGGKADLQGTRSVRQEDVDNLKRALHFYDYVECSAKTGHNVESIFENITKTMLKKI